MVDKVPARINYNGPDPDGIAEFQTGETIDKQFLPDRTTGEISDIVEFATSPTVNDDSGSGYLIGSRWVNTALNKEFVCSDNSVGAAVWNETTGMLSDAEVKTAYENNADTNAFTDSEQTKLTGIEDSATADQSGAEIKTAYELEADTNAFTDSEQTKLTGIETSATTDQTGAEIKTAYELEADTNAFTDNEQTKLGGIEALADVTDSTNVEASGAVMESDTTTVSMSFVIDEDTMVSNLPTKVPTQQSVKAYVDSSIASQVVYKGGYDADTNTPNLDSTPAGIKTGFMYTVTVAGTFYTIDVEIGDVLISEQDDPTLETHWTIVNKDLDAASIKVSYESNADTNAFTDTKQTKLTGIEDNATADQTDAEIKTAYENNADTNAFTDSEQTKLTGIEALADVTDSTNVEASGATMDTDTSLVGNGYFLDEDTMSSDSDTKVPSQQSVKAYADNLKLTESFSVACSDETTDLTVGTAKITFRMPYAFTITDVRASVTTAPTGSTIIVDINEGGVSILSTLISIDAGEKTSVTAVTAPVISDSSLADDAEMTIDLDQIGSTIAGTGLKVTIIGTRT